MLARKTLGALRSNFAYTETEVGEGEQGGDEGTDLSKYCGSSV